MVGVGSGDLLHTALLNDHASEFYASGIGEIAIFGTPNIEVAYLIPVMKPALCVSCTDHAAPSRECLSPPRLEAPPP